MPSNRASSPDYSVVSNTVGDGGNGGGMEDEEASGMGYVLSPTMGSTRMSECSSFQAK